LGVIEAASVVVASLIALATVNSWRAQQQRERKLQVGTDALVLAYEALDAMKAVRTAFGYAEEGSKRDRFPDEPEWLTGKLNDAYATIERVNQHQELFGKLRAMRYRLMAEFGPQWRTAFDEVFDFRGKLQSRAISIMRHAYREWKGQNTPQSDERYQKMYAELEALRWEDDENDPVNTQLRKIIERLEDLNASIRDDMLRHRVWRWLRTPRRAEATARPDIAEATAAAPAANAVR